MNQPRHARLTALEYRDARPKIAKDTSVLRVHYTVNDEYYQFPVSNIEWSLDCPALQLLALYGYQPTDLDTYTDVEQPRFFAVTHEVADSSTTESTAESEAVGSDEDGEWLPVQGWLGGGRDALSDAPWFDPSLGKKSSDSDSDGPGGGGSPDPGTGNRAGVDHDTDDGEDTGVTSELTPNADTGVNVTVE